MVEYDPSKLPEFLEDLYSIGLDFHRMDNARLGFSLRGLRKELHHFLISFKAKMDVVVDASDRVKKDPSVFGSKESLESYVRAHHSRVLADFATASTAAAVRRFLHAKVHLDDFVNGEIALETDFMAEYDATHKAISLEYDALIHAAEEGKYTVKSVSILKSEKQKVLREFHDSFNPFLTGHEVRLAYCQFVDYALNNLPASIGYKGKKPVEKRLAALQRLYDRDGRSLWQQINDGIAPRVDEDVAVSLRIISRYDADAEVRGLAAKMYNTYDIRDGRHLNPDIKDKVIAGPSLLSKHIVLPHDRIGMH